MTEQRVTAARDFFFVCGGARDGKLRLLSIAPRFVREKPLTRDFNHTADDRVTTGCMNESDAERIACFQGI